jgi:hypothetical protein
MSEIDELIGQSVTLRKVTPSFDGLGHLEEESTEDVTIKGILQPISEKDKEILEVGEFISGDVKGYFKHKYIRSGVEYTVETNDIIIDWDNTEWRVLKIFGKWSWGTEEIFRKCLLRRITKD